MSGEQSVKLAVYRRDGWRQAEQDRQRQHNELRSNKRLEEAFTMHSLTVVADQADNVNRKRLSVPKTSLLHVQCHRDIRQCTDVKILDMILGTLTIILTNTECDLFKNPRGRRRHGGQKVVKYSEEGMSSSEPGVNSL